VRNIALSPVQNSQDHYASQRLTGRKSSVR
jgi:hypothetical protein